MRYTDLEQGKVLLIDKPYAWTSFDVVNKMKWLLKDLVPAGKKLFKIGHAGTLDPLATGLLIICTGKETKNIDNYQAWEKEYTGSFILGATTPSGDKETEVDQHFPTEHLTEALIREKATAFTGTILQKPPVFSAVKIGGKRAYKMARKGKPMEMRAKEVTVSTFDIGPVEIPKVNFRVVCSKGTYIRSLAVDLGAALGSGAYLDSLRRTRIGQYQLADAMEISVFEKKLSAENENL